MMFIKDNKFGWAYSGRLFWGKFHIEYNLWSKTCQIKVSRRVFSLAIPPIALWVCFGEEESDDEISIRIFDWAIWWDFWSGEGWDSKTPRWRDGCFHIDNFFLGRRKYERKVVEEKEVEVPMPEGSYRATVKLCEDTWKRPRWGKKVIKRVDIEIPDGIPHPGKGENSWDCGDDATFGICCPAVSIADGVGKLVGSVLRDRVRYGSYSCWNWKKELSER